MCVKDPRYSGKVYYQCRCAKYQAESEKYEKTRKVVYTKFHIDHQQSLKILIVIGCARPIAIPTNARGKNPAHMSEPDDGKSEGEKGSEALGYSVDNNRTMNDDMLSKSRQTGLAAARECQTENG